MSALRFILFGLMVAPALSAQTVQPPDPAATTSSTYPSPQARETAAPPPATPTRADVLRGAYGLYRANNDLLYYHLDVRVDPVAEIHRRPERLSASACSKTAPASSSTCPTCSLSTPSPIGRTPLKYTRDSGALFIDFPTPLRKAQTYASHGRTTTATRSPKGRFGGMSFEADPAGRPWIFTADEDDGCSIYWPCKDQWRDEPQDGMDISVAVPNDLIDISNGRFVSKLDLHDGYNQWNWHVSYPINSYDVALNIGAYTHFADTYASKQFQPLSLDFYALPEDLDKARAQFAQARGMLDAFEHYFGEYPFARDGYKLIQVPYAGMEHQSAVAYGNGFDNGYLHRDWTGVGISPRFDFIIIHESGHEWFGNAVSAADRADMWIHEGWTTYLETLFVEFQYGQRGRPQVYAAASIPKVHNRTPIVGERGVNRDPPQDQYFKGALMLATLRSVLDDDARWFSLIKAFYQHFKYQNILTEDVIAWWNGNTRLDLTGFFNQYLRRAAIPTPRTKLQHTGPNRPLQVAGRRDCLCHARQGRRPLPLANHPSHQRSGRRSTLHSARTTSTSRPTSSISTSAKPLAPQQTSPKPHASEMPSHCAPDRLPCAAAIAPAGRCA